MLCKLMHKDVVVAAIELDEDTGSIHKVVSTVSPAHLPVGVGYRNEVVDKAALNDWWTGRSIPASRSGIREALESLNIASTKMLLTKCYGLSLSDRYWICPEGTELSWGQINFFDNPFSDDMGDVLFGSRKEKGALDFSSPDNTSDGQLKKRWKIIDGERVLIKGGSNPFRQQPFNEVIACKVMDCLGIEHVPYRVIWSEGYPYSVCPDFVTRDSELVSAWRVMKSKKQRNDASAYTHYISCCEEFGIKDITLALDKMLVLDFIIANEDRHFNNFGLLRNAQTLEWLGVAPIFDSGNSLGFDKGASQIRHEREFGSRPFGKDPYEQLKLVKSFAWIDFPKLENIPAVVFSELSAPEVAEYVEIGRAEAIAALVESRIRFLRTRI